MTTAASGVVRTVIVTVPSSAVSCQTPRRRICRRPRSGSMFRFTVQYPATIRSTWVAVPCFATTTRSGSLFGRRDTGDRTDLRVRQLAGRERFSRHREGLERAGNPYVISRRAGAHSALPGQPVRAAEAFPGLPSLPPVELGHEHEPSAGGRRDVAGECGDLRFEPLQGTTQRLVDRRVRLDHRHLVSSVRAERVFAS